MGLNVYFCDVCGVRVTDVDLRSGHGMLHGQDVICATCLDMGHGKEWLASRGAAPVHATNGRGAPATNHAAVLDHARDRAATVPDRNEPATAVANHGSPSDFAGAAAGFAAMSTPRRRESDDADGEVSLESTDQVDPHLLEASNKAAAAARKVSDDEHIAAPYVAPEDDDESSALVDVNEEAPDVQEPETDAAGESVPSRKSSSSKGSLKKPGANDKSGSKSSSRVTKPSTNSKNSKSSTKSATRSGRKPAAGGMPTPLKISLITVPVIILLAAFFYFGSAGGGKHREPAVKDQAAQKEQIQQSFVETKNMINDAWTSRKLADMKAANERWQQFQQEWDRFSKDAETYSKWTEDDCAEFYQQLHAPDVGARTKLLRDEIVKQSAH